MLRKNKGNLFKESLESKERIFMLQNRRHFKLRLHGIDVAELNVKYILSNQSGYESAWFSVSTMEEDRVEKICDVLNVSFFKHNLKYGEEYSIHEMVGDENYVESFMRYGIDEEAEKILREMLGSEEYKKLMWKTLVKEFTQNF
ncbi:MAG: hypothetical protein J7L45_00245 [Candidatus Aenigmarchaeota archaeon]|nr:hypothetical protein [Candidatus Aenigmarchaeota archaeon]